MSKPGILVFGEVLWDMLPSGKKMGGAPSNFAYHTRVLGADSMVCTSVGNDDLGHEIRREFKLHGIPDRFLSTDSSLPTGTVLVHLDEKGHPAYEIVEHVAWDHIQTNDALLDWAQGVSAFYFGSLALRGRENRKTVRDLLQAIPPKSMKIFDLNLRAPFYSQELIDELLWHTTVFKLNDEELVILGQMFGKMLGTEFVEPSGPFDSEVFLTACEPFARHLMDFYSLRYLVLTCGANGSYIMGPNGQTSFCPAVAATVVDTVGAGDSFTAVCATGLLLDMPLDTINKNANQYAAYVCGQSGAMPPIPDDLKCIFSK